MTYAEVLKKYEFEPSDIVYVSGKLSELDELDKGFSDFVEHKDFKYKKYNLMSMELSWTFDMRSDTRGWSRKKKRKINNRLLRFFKNKRKSLKALEVLREMEVFKAIEHCKVLSS